MESTTLLKAGAILLKGAKLPKDILSDDVVARLWHHPALEDPIVRLPTQNMLRGIDLEMDLLGFDEADKMVVVGKQRREKLGFPGWPLVHDPEHARYALDVVKDLKRATRRIKSKPGTAKEMVDEIASRLSASVPHFLPSFYEEAARAFLVFENYAYASQFFEKARNAERVYALDVDPELREQTFVDFALARALSIKSLTNFGLEMIEKGEAEQGFQSYFRIAVRRTRGGLPPSATMAKDLKKLAKAAGLDPAEEERNFLNELFGASALKKASAGFWKAYKKSLVALGKERPSARSEMLDLFPDVPSITWLEILESCGALKALYENEVETEAKSKHLTADWFALLFKQTNEANLRILNLFEQCSGRIKEDGIPIAFAEGWRKINQDVVEFGLELGITFKLPKEPRFIDIDDYSENLGEEGQCRDWVNIAQDEAFRKMAKRSIEAGSSYYMDRWVNLIPSRPALKEIVGEWLSEKIGKESDDKSALVSSYKKLRLFDGYSKKIWGYYPEQTQRLVATDLSIPLKNSLQIGVWDELVWPEWEEAIGKFAKAKKVSRVESFPYMILFDKVKVVVFGPKGIEIEGDIPSHKGFKISEMLYTQGALLMVYEKGWRETKAQWFGKADFFKLETSIPSGTPVYLEDGRAMFDGYRICTPGDRDFPGDWERRKKVISDGTHFWSANYYGNSRYLSFDPINGKTIENGPKPPFLTNEEPYKGDLRFIPGAKVDAPLPTKDEICAYEWAADPDKYYHLHYKDILGNVYEGGAIGLMIRIPGDDHIRTVKRSYSNFGIGLDGVVGATSHKGFRKGGYPNIVNAYMAYFQTRDENGSQALRNISIESCVAFLEAAKEGKKEIAQKVDELLPEITDEALKKGVVGYIKMAHKQRKLLTGLTKKLKELKKEANTPTYEKDPEGLVEGLAGLISISSKDSGHVILAQLKDITDFFLNEEAKDGDGGQRPDGTVLWETLIGQSAGAAFRYAMIASTQRKPEVLEALKTFLYAMADSPFVGKDLSKRVRYFEFERQFKDKERDKEIVPPWRNKIARDVVMSVYQGNPFFTWANGWYSVTAGMEYARSGSFSEMVPTRLRTIGRGWGTRDELDAFFALIEKNGSLPLAECIPAFMKKTGLSEPEASLAISSWKKSQLDKKMKVGTLSWASKIDRLQDKSELEFFSSVFLSGPIEDLWNAEKLEERLSATWLEGASRVPQLEPGFVSLFQKQTNGSVSILREIADIKLAKDLNTDQEWEWKDGYRQKGEGGFDSFSHYVEATDFILYYSRAGSEIYKGIPQVWKKIRERIENPDYLIEIDTVWNDEMIAEYSKSIKGKPKNISPENEYETKGSKGVFSVKSSSWLDIYVNWNAIKEDHPIVEKVLAQSFKRPVGEMKFVFSKQVDEIIDRIESTPLPDGAFEANPIFSVPKLVATLQKKYKISEDAAALYLQLAALPFPSDANVRRWNGWNKKTHDAAIADLVKVELVLQAKRARASRGVFIPGPWEPKTWSKPIESWKFKHLGWSDVQGELNSYIRPFSNCILVPPHRLFERVWERIQSGDAPGFEDPPK